MKRILITGGTGFIGRHAIPALLERGYEVHAIARNTDDLPDTVTAHAFDLLQDHQRLDALLAAIQPTHLLHLAWTVEPGKFWNAQDNHDWVEASQSLYSAFARNGGTRAVIAGTCAEYGWDNLSRDAVLHETRSPLTPATLYGQSKLGLFRDLESKAVKDGVSLAWGRIFFLYGPGEKPGRLISDVIRALLNNQTIETTEGTQLRDFMHVADVAGAFAALCDSDDTGAFNIASGEALPMARILHEIARQTNGETYLKLGARPMPENEPPAIVADIDRLRRATGFTPRHTIETGIAESIAYWRHA